MADDDVVDRKKAKKDAKRKDREEELKTKELPEHEKYNVKKKDDEYQNKQKRHEEQEKFVPLSTLTIPDARPSRKTKRKKSKRT